MKITAKKISRFMLPVVLVLIAGCGQGLKEEVPPAVTPEVTRMQQTSLPATAAASPTAGAAATPQATREKVMEINCLEIQPALPELEEIEGYAVLSTRDGAFSKNAYLLDLSSGEERQLPVDQGWSFAGFVVAPDFEKIAYFTIYNKNTNNIKIYVVDSEGKVLAERATTRDKWWSISHWQDDEYLFMNAYRKSLSHVPGYPLPGVLYNPISGEEKRLRMDYPNIITQPVGDLWPVVYWINSGTSAAAYSPDLTRAVYMRDDRYIVLWDVNGDRAISERRAGYSGTDGPVWSPDGSEFIIGLPVSLKPPLPTHREEDNEQMELYRINRTGGVKRLTHLLEEYESVTIRGYSWSPDGRKIAVGLMTEPDNLPLYGIEPRVYMRATIYNRVAILDVTTGVVTNLCIPVENEGLSISQWSPDSRFLLVNHVTEYDSLGEARDTVLIDLQQGSAATIAKQTVPIGWMLESQE